MIAVSQYHHIPFVKGGNFGNTTVFRDYVYGTIIPESIEHIETGKMPEKVCVRPRYDMFKLCTLASK
jgi:sterol desaturase/sphingolipid hydroxylase (fatty acid hydroxylase superfamily)